MFIIVVLSASIVWFILASILFFNPIIDKVYRSEEGNPAVRALPKSTKTIGMILVAILIQSFLWAYVYVLITAALPGDKLAKGLLFSLILVLTKMIPRDIDRILLTTYPKKRMTIEFVIGVICSVAIGLIFGFLL